MVGKVECYAKGGQSLVFLNGREVSKVFTGEDSQQALENEVRALKALQETEVAPTLIQFTPKAITMEKIEGVTLYKHQKNEVLDWEEKKDLILDITKGLREIHSKGVAHLDLCEWNIMVTKENNVKIVDFGLAKTSMRDYRHHVASGKVAGKMAYSSPEKCTANEYRSRFQQDVFALGVIFFKLYYGFHPFIKNTTGCKNVDIGYAIVESEVKWPDIPDISIPNDIKNVIEGALRKDASKRYKSAAAMLEDLT